MFLAKDTCCTRMCVHTCAHTRKADSVQTPPTSLTIDPLGLRSQGDEEDQGKQVPQFPFLNLVLKEKLSQDQLIWVFCLYSEDVVSLPAPLFPIIQSRIKDPSVRCESHRDTQGCPEGQGLCLSHAWHPLVLPASAAVASLGSSHPCRPVPRNTSFILFCRRASCFPPQHLQQLKLFHLFVCCLSIARLPSTVEAPLRWDLAAGLAPARRQVWPVNVCGASERMNERILPKLQISSRTKQRPRGRSGWSGSAEPGGPPVPSRAFAPPRVSESLPTLVSPLNRGALPRKLLTHPPALLFSQAHISFGVIIKITYSPAGFFFFLRFNLPRL